jgi:hypothetical protein
MEDSDASTGLPVPNRNTTPVAVQKAIFRASQTGRPLRQVAKDLGVSVRTVIKYAAPRPDAPAEAADNDDRNQNAAD